MVIILADIVSLSLLLPGYRLYLAILYASHLGHRTTTVLIRGARKMIGNSKLGWSKIESTHQRLLIAHHPSMHKAP
jgi:hypothetical protein